MADIAKIVPFLWYTEKAYEAAQFYVSLFPNSRIDSVSAVPSDNPSGPADSVGTVEFTLAGHQFFAMSAGPYDPFNHAISLMVLCDDQAEIDRLWSKLSEGGKPEPCGWLKDRYGVSWQIAPRRMGEMMKDKDRAKAKRVMDAVMKMGKLDAATLERAYAGG